MHTYMKKNERKRRARLRIMTVFAAFTAAICIFMASGSHMRSHEVQASSVHSVEKVYQSIRVNSGENLWSIAESYGTKFGVQRSDYMKEIREINHISEKDVLQAGSYIIIPCYIETAE